MLSDSRRTCLRVISEAIRTQITRFPVGLVIFHPSRSAVVLSCSVPRGIPRFSFFYSAGSDAGLFVCLFPGIECRCSLFCSRVFSPAAFLCSVPLPVSRPLFLFCRMLSGLFVCLFPGIECRCSSPSMER